MILLKLLWRFIEGLKRPDDGDGEVNQMTPQTFMIEVLVKVQDFHTMTVGNGNDAASLIIVTRAVNQQMLDGLLSQPARTMWRRVKFETMEVMTVIAMACQELSDFKRWVD